jgi:hypothetical protein
MRRRLVLPVVLATVACASTAQAQATTCPTTAEASQITAKELKTLNAKLGGFGARPTGSPNHKAYLDWLDKQLRAIDGVERQDLSYKIRPWSEQEASLELNGEELPLVGPVPFAASTPKGGTTKKLVYLPATKELTKANSKGRIVVRDVPAGSVPWSTLKLISWSIFDPDHTFDGAVYERPFLGGGELDEDVENAAKAGAAGVVFTGGFPAKEIKGRYAPYEGISWKTPMLYVGADEGLALERAARKHGKATLTLRGRRDPGTTRTLLATIPGKSPERIVIGSHTDGVSPLWDNGPIAMLAMARYFASLPLDCRPKTIEFAFTTAHLYQHLRGKPDERDAGAELLAQQLDRDYDKGTVAGVLVLEHLGSREYDAVKRPAGKPGRTLELTGLPEPTLVLVSDSTALVDSATHAVTSHDLRRHALLHGAGAPTATVPQYCSFGGEGTPYNKHLLPTVAVIAAPWVLFDSAHGMEAIDFSEMQRQTVAFSDVVFDMGRLSRAAIAGKTADFRAQRAAGAKTCFDE